MGLLMGGQFDANDGSRSFFRSYFDDALMLIHNPFGHHQPDAGATGSFGAEKALKNLILNLPGHAAAGIDHLIFNSPVFRLFGSDRHAFAGGTIFPAGVNCIGHKIQQAAVNAFRIKAHGYQLIAEFHV